MRAVAKFDTYISDSENELLTPANVQTNAKIKIKFYVAISNLNFIMPPHYAECLLICPQSFRLGHP